eukprot:Gb_17705 [translate_table: standard]
MQVHSKAPLLPYLLSSSSKNPPGSLEVVSELIPVSTVHYSLPNTQHSTFHCCSLLLSSSVIVFISLLPLFALFPSVWVTRCHLAVASPVCSSFIACLSLCLVSCLSYPHLPSPITRLSPALSSICSFPVTFPIFHLSSSPFLLHFYTQCASKGRHGVASIASR